MKETWLFACSPSLWLASSSILMLQLLHSFAATGPIFLSYPTQTKDQELSRRPPDLQCHTGMYEIPSLASWVEQTPESQPVRCETAIVRLSRLYPISQPNKSPFNSYYPFYQFCSSRIHPLSGNMVFNLQLHQYLEGGGV